MSPACSPLTDLIHQVREVGGRKVTVFEQESEESRIASIVLRASTQNVLDDVERAVDDGKTKHER